MSSKIKLFSFLGIVMVLFYVSCELSSAIEAMEVKEETNHNALLEEKYLPEGIMGMKISLKELLSREISNTLGSPYVSIKESSEGQYAVTVNTRPEGKIHYRSILFSVYNDGAPSGWSINIGDSSSNNGWGGDSNHQSCDAELQVYNNTLAVYADDYGGSALLHSQDSHIPITNQQNIRYRIEDRKVSYWKNFDEKNMKEIMNKNLFALDGQEDSSGPENYTIYAAFNRTVGSSSRGGSGITDVYIYLQDPINYDYKLINPGTDYTVTLEHLKWRDGVWSWSDWKANKEFPGYTWFLNDYNANDWNEKESEHIFIAEVWAPPAGMVENIVFLSAGQQGALADRMDFKAVVTGQPENWHAASGLNGWKYIKNKKINITWKSVAGQIIADAENNGSRYFGFKPENTYMALVFDACFYYEMSAAGKNNRLTDYLEWTMSRCANNAYGKLRKIYLAGASRGGALVTRMAYELRQNSLWKNKVADAEIIVSSFDGVANEKEGELQTGSNILALNPDGKGKAFHSTFTGGLTNSHDLHILQIAGGQKVTFLSSARAFHFYDTPYADFRWVSRSHTDIGREWFSDTTVAQLQWLNDRINNR